MITPLGISEAYFKLLYNVGYALMAIIALVWAYQKDRGNEDKLPSFISKHALPFFVLYFIAIVGFRDVSECRYRYGKLSLLDGRRCTSDCKNRGNIQLDDERFK